MKEVNGHGFLSLQQSPQMREKIRIQGRVAKGNEVLFIHDGNGLKMLSLKLPPVRSSRLCPLEIDASCPVNQCTGKGFLHDERLLVHGQPCIKRLVTIAVASQPAVFALSGLFDHFRDIDCLLLEGIHQQIFKPFQIHHGHPEEEYCKEQKNEGDGHWLDKATARRIGGLRPEFKNSCNHGMWLRINFFSSLSEDNFFLGCRTHAKQFQRQSTAQYIMGILTINSND